jgi:hypothetical protein
MFESFGVLQFASGPTIDVAAPKIALDEEAGAVTFTVSRTGGTFGQASIDYTTIDGTAQGDSDYKQSRGTLTWAAGDIEDKSFTVMILSDRTKEADETFSVSLLNPSGGVVLGTPQLLQLTLTEVPWFSSVQLVMPQHKVQESKGEITLLVTRAGSSKFPLTVDYATVDGTATAGSDYQPVNGTLNWGNGDRKPKPIKIPLVTDTIDEADETFVLALSNIMEGAQYGPNQQTTVTIIETPASATPPSPGTPGTEPGEGSGTGTPSTQPGTGAPGTEPGTGVPGTEPGTPGTEPGTGSPGTEGGSPPVVEKPSPGILQFSAPSYDIDERDGSVTIGVTRTEGNSGAIAVNYATQNDSAYAAREYTESYGKLRWADGETSEKQFRVSILDDTLMEEPKRLIVILSNPTEGATLGENIQAAINIIDDDKALLQFSSKSYIATESSNQAVITVSRNGGRLGEASVDYATSDSTAKAGEDYTATQGTLTWLNGEDYDKTITIPLVFDRASEGNEIVVLTLSNASDNAGLGTPSEATLTITESDSKQCESGQVVDCALISEDKDAPPLQDARISPKGTVAGVKLAGNVKNAGWVQDVELMPNTQLTGGTVTGEISGPSHPNQSDQPAAILRDVNITTGAKLSNVVIGGQSVIDPAVIESEDGLGEGVRFETNSLIPEERDLGNLLGRMQEDVFGQYAVNLADDVLYNSARGGILGAINSLSQLKNNGFVLRQNPKTGFLEIESADILYAVLPMQVKHIMKKQVARDIRQGVYLQPDHSVIFITHTGREVITQPVMQAPRVFNQALRSFGLERAIMQDNGNIQIPFDKANYLMVRSSLYSQQVPAETALGFAITNSAVSFVFDDDKSIRRHQPIYPASADPEALQTLFKNDAVLGSEGQVVIRAGTRRYHGLFDYLVTRGQKRESGTQIQEMGDLNHDGCGDYRIDYRNGDSQIMYCLP